MGTATRGYPASWVVDVFFPPLWFCSETYVTYVVGRGSGRGMLLPRKPRKIAWLAQLNTWLSRPKWSVGLLWHVNSRKQRVPVIMQFSANFISSLLVTVLKLLNFFWNWDVQEVILVALHWFLSEMKPRKKRLKTRKKKNIAVIIKYSNVKHEQTHSV